MKSSRRQYCKSASDGWLFRFLAGGFDLYNIPWSRRPTEVALFKSNSNDKTWETAETFNIYYSSIHDYLKKLGYKRLLDILVPGKLKLYLTAL